MLVHDFATLMSWRNMEDESERLLEYNKPFIDLRDANQVFSHM